MHAGIDAAAYVRGVRLSFAYGITRASGDPSFRDDFDTAKEGEGAEDAQKRFKPAADVLSSKTYGMEIFQEFACLTHAEFTKVCGLRPEDAGISPYEAPVRAPSTSTSSTWWGPKA